MTLALGLLAAVGAAAAVALVVAGMLDRVPTPAPFVEFPEAEVAVTPAIRSLREILAARFEGTTRTGSRTTRRGLARALARADLNLRPHEFVFIQAGLAFLVGIIALARFGVSPVVVLFAIGGFFAPRIYVGLREGQRVAAFDAALPRAMELLASAIGGGRSVTQALAIVVSNTTPPLSEELGVAVREVELGASLEQALNNIVSRLGSNDLQLMVMTINVQRITGGDLPAILHHIAKTMRDRQQMRDELSAGTAQVRGSALIITALPVVVGVFLYFVTPEYFRPMLSTVIGWVFLGIAGVLLVVGNALIRTLTRIG